MRRTSWLLHMAGSNKTNNCAALPINIYTETGESFCSISKTEGIDGRKVGILYCAVVLQPKPQ
jgi:hypothetical protein